MQGGLFCRTKVRPRLISPAALMTNTRGDCPRRRVSVEFSNGAETFCPTALSPRPRLRPHCSHLPVGGVWTTQHDLAARGGSREGPRATGLLLAHAQQANQALSEWHAAWDQGRGDGGMQAAAPCGPPVPLKGSPIWHVRGERATSTTTTATQQQLERSLTGTPRGLSSLTGTPRGLSSLTGTPRGLSSLTGTPRGLCPAHQTQLSALGSGVSSDSALETLD
uniref:Uncharacterized protein n=1 Tax=Knipowitschia caucasica TaxID=637954 RepID=A0AAV2JJ18_KNICA